MNWLLLFPVTCGIFSILCKTAPDLSNDESVLRMCTEAGLQCEPCGECFPGGWCVQDQSYGKRCICMYGWTGSDAKYLPQINDNEGWGRNRIVANDCKQACHYTHHVRNKTCVTPSSDPPSSDPPPSDPPGCHPYCTRKTGICMPDGRCRCSRGWSGPGATYERNLDRYVAEYCNKECPYLGYGIPNPGCKEKPIEISPCNLLCQRNDGICVEKIGKCLCPLSWTGPHPEYGKGDDDDDDFEGRILADYCLVHCPYTDKKRNDLCVNADYVRRLQLQGNIA